MKKQETRRALAPLIATAVTLSAMCPAFADDELATNLPPIIVQASRLGKSTLQMPATVQVITGDEIAASGLASTAEVLEKKGGVFIRTMNGTPALAQLAMRGFGDNSFGRVLVLVNGERLNNPDMSTPNLLRVPVGSISRIEIIRGPQTVLHGDYASAGVVNIITDDSTAEPLTTLGMTAGAYDSYSAFVNTTGSFSEDGVSYRASADWDKSDGYRDNSDYEAYEINAALRKAFGENRFISLSAFYHDAEYGLPGSLSRDRYLNAPRTTTTPHDRSELESFGLNLGGRATVGADGYIDARVTASRREIDSRWHGVSYGSPWTSLYSGTVDSYAFLPQYVLDTQVAGFRNIFTLGADLRYDTTEFSSDYIAPPYSSFSDWNYDRASYAGYAQDELFLTDTLSVTLGGRAEWFDNRVRSAGSTTSFSSREAALEIALLYRPTDTTKLYAKAGRFYHAPFIDEIFAGAGTPNLALDAETGFNLEVGAEAQFASEWTASLALYDMELQDEIYYDPVTYQNRNSPGDTRRLGLDSSIRWSRHRVGAASLAYSAVRSEFTGGAYDGNTMPLVPAHTLSLNGEYYIIHDLALMAGMRYVSKQVLGSDFGNDGERIKPYAIVDCGVRYEPGFLDGLRVTLGVDNLFGKEYCDYAGWSGSSYWYPARGRFWRVGASYTF